jgi:hypothetical protein
VQAIQDTAGEAMVATTGREEEARRGEEDGEARGPTAVAGEFQCAVVNVFFLPPFGQHNVPTKGVFFFFLFHKWWIFFPTLYKNKKKNWKK